METILSQLVNAVTGYISSTGYVGIFVLMTLESALIPIPSEATMPFAGFLASTGKLDFWMASLVGTLGNVVGSAMAYALGYYGGEDFCRKIIKKYGKFMLLTLKEFDRAKDWFVKYGEAISFGSRLLPAVRTFISLPAGISRMSFKKFIIYTALGSFFWSTALTYFGYKLGENWDSLKTYFHQFDALIIGVCLLGGVYFVVHRIREIKKQEKT